DDRHELRCRMAFQLLEEGDAIHYRHVHVADDEVHALRRKLVERLASIARFNDFIPLLAQSGARDRADGARVIDDENLLGHASPVQKNVTSCEAPVRWLSPRWLRRCSSVV